MAKITKNIPLAIATVALGIIVGFSSLLVSVALDLTEKLFLHFQETNLIPVDISAGGMRRFTSVLIGGIIAAIIWYLLQRHYKPVKLGKTVAGQHMPLIKTMIHVYTQIFFVGTGNSIGRELAPREAGAALAQKWADHFRDNKFLDLDAEDRRMIIAAAAGAGFAGVYIAPITGAVFCMELLYKKINARVIAVSLTMSVIATLIGSIVKGYQPYYLVGSKSFSLQILPLALFLGLVCGFLGTLFKKYIGLAKAHRTTKINILAQLPAIAAVTGGIAAFFPQIMGNGRGLAQMAMNTTGHSRTVILVLLFGLVAKVLVTLFVMKCGGYGGVLTPSIAVGAVIGAFAGMVYVSLVPGVTMAQAAVLGAAFLLAASQQAPLMAMFMLFEVCHLNFSAFLPLAMGVAISIALSKWLQTKAFFA
ncbi:MAG: chloride channel protein [Limosilactobacillus pontis]|uniref:Chloride channel protein n=1 Tax=Limosilactobacillus pontis TaxID=35787 RepID=A0A2J6NMB6_9LACO|nr:chloride channel protein [Limosilactobacillus pontis]PMB82461.1 chloride channel protein [Limosilactobacillus pontis]